MRLLKTLQVCCPCTDTPQSSFLPATACATPQAVVATSAGALGAGLVWYKTTDIQRQFELASASGSLLRLMDPETSHKLGIFAAKMGLFPTETRPDPEVLRVSLWGRQFPNPIGEEQMT